MADDERNDLFMQLVITAGHTKSKYIHSVWSDSDVTDIDHTQHGKERSTRVNNMFM
jgi:hypothetical protein